MWEFKKKNPNFSWCRTWTHSDGVVVVFDGINFGFEIYHPLMEDEDCVYVEGLIELRSVLKSNFNLLISDKDLLKFWEV